MKYIYIFGFIFLFSCSQTPPEVNASVALVEQTPTRNLSRVPDKISLELENARQGANINYKNFTLILGKKYTSALGNLCRNFEVKFNDSKKELNLEDQVLENNLFQSNQNKIISKKNNPRKTNKNQPRVACQTDLNQNQSSENKIWYVANPIMSSSNSKILQLENLTY